jgi:hypothetical protein
MEEKMVMVELRATALGRYECVIVQDFEVKEGAPVLEDLTGRLYGSSNDPSLKT